MFNSIQLVGKGSSKFIFAIWCSFHITFITTTTFIIMNGLIHGKSIVQCITALLILHSESPVTNPNNFLQTLFGLKCYQSHNTFYEIGSNQNSCTQIVFIKIASTQIVFELYA